MSIFTRFTLRSLARNRTRTVVSVIGVMLACALITAVLTSVVSLSDMLVRRTGADEGWWYAEATGVNQNGLDRVRSDADITDWTHVEELGTVDLTDANDDVFGRYLFAKTWPGAQDADEPLLALPEVIEGRAPEKAGEIILPHYMDGAVLEPCGLSTTDGAPIQIGSTVTLSLGTRTVTNLQDGSTYVATSADGSWIDEETQHEAFDANLGTVTGTVVGFYRAYGYASTMALSDASAYVYDDGSTLDRVVSDDSPATLASVLFRTADPADAEAIARELADSSEAELGTTTHGSLLRWMGITPDTAIWDTLYWIAGILAAVVMVAGISLVYNSFAISVAERTRQFGLLSSLGASKRQLRRTVLTEALVIGAIGIPAGLLLGLAGCYVVFALTGEGLAALVHGAAAAVVVSPLALGISAALALVTLLISAWIPALRASHVSAVDAIRQVQDVHLTRRARRAQERAVRSQGNAGSHARSLGLAGRVFGVPGFVAHRNLTRSASKGRVTVGALAVSVALLIVSGSIANVMGYASGTAVDTLDGQDLVVSIDATGAGGSGALAQENGQVDDAAMQDVLKRFYADVRQVDGARANGYTTSYVAEMLVPVDMLSSGIEGLEGSQPRFSDGSWYGSAYVDFVDEDTWEAYVDGLGLPRDEFCDAAHPRAIVVNSYGVHDDGTYQSYQPFANAGTVRSIEWADLDGRYISGVEEQDDGSLAAFYYDYDDDGQEHTMPLDEAIGREEGIEVAALAENAPACVSPTGTLQLVLPASAISLADTMAYLRATCTLSTDGDAAAASDAQEAIEQIAADYPELDCTYSNVAEAALQARLMASTVNTFIYCFAVITGLIAVANVFNTLTNSLMLRRREFAMLKSIGMGNRAFRRMIAYECASYALRGFLIGFVLAAAVSFMLYQAMQLSYSTYTFQLPWMQVGLAALIVLAVIVVSVMYALGRSRGTSVVEALRDDAI